MIAFPGNDREYLVHWNNIGEVRIVREKKDKFAIEKTEGLRFRTVRNRKEEV